MFRNDAQIAAVCAALCDPLPRLRGYWGPSGCRIAPSEIGSLSHGERVVWAFSWSIWSQWTPKRGAVKLPELLVLDGPNLRRVGSLLVALSSYTGSEAVDRWLAEQRAA